MKIRTTMVSGEDLELLQALKTTFWLSVRNKQNYNLEVVSKYKNVILQ